MNRLMAIMEAIESGNKKSMGEKIRELYEWGNILTTTGKGIIKGIENPEIRRVAVEIADKIIGM